MSVKVGAESLSPLANAALAAVVILLVAGAADTVLAQAAPFGVPRPQAAPTSQIGGVTGWTLAKQAEFYRQFSGLIRGAKALDMDRVRARVEEQKAAEAAEAALATHRVCPTARRGKFS